jgi:hypothetical protein
MVSKGFDTLAKSKDGRLPFHYFIDCGLLAAPYNITEDSAFLNLIFSDLIQNLPVDFTLPEVKL